MCAILTPKQATESNYTLQIPPTMDALFGVKAMPVPQPLEVITSKYIIKPLIMIL